MYQYCYGLGWQQAEEVFNLFAFPLECNFSGAKFDLNLVKYVQGGKHVDNNCRYISFSLDTFIWVVYGKDCG